MCIKKPFRMWLCLSLTSWYTVTPVAIMHFFRFIVHIRRYFLPYTFLSIPVIFLFLIGINVYGWRTSGVNHVLIFELDPRNHLSEQHLMEMAAIFGVLWTLSVLAFLYARPLGIPTYANPLALVLFMLLFLLNPTHTLRHNARFWLLRVLVSPDWFGWTVHSH